MSTVVEEFDNAEERDARFNELKERGHRLSKHTDPVPVRWENHFFLTYSPEERRKKKEPK